MLSKKDRLKNKSRGPWGMKNFNFTYKVTEEDIDRHRFITAPTEEGAIEQFEAVIQKLGVAVEILTVEEIED